MAIDVRDYISQNNYDLIKKNHPKLLKQLEEFGVAPVGEIVFGPGTKPNLKINNNGNTVFIHPEHDPESEQNYFLSNISEDFSGVEVILGMGLGYSVKAVLRKRKSIRYLVVIENDPGIFLQALKYMDLSDLLTDPKVIIGLRPEDAESLLAPITKALSFEDTQILEHLVIASLYKASHTNLHSMVFNYVNNYNIAGATKIKFGEKVVVNRFEHLKSLGHYFLFETLLDKFLGIPAYIVAAGPSLDQNIQFLKQVQDKAVIICVDSALTALLYNDIRPDFVTSIDYKDDTYEKIVNIITDIPAHTGLLVYSWVAPKIVRNFPGNRKFYLFTETGIDKWVNSLVTGKKYFAGSSSVANLNFIAAKLMGCSPVIFIGQDLSYGAGQAHSKSAILTAQDHVRTCLETGKDIVWIKGVQGGKVPTTRGMKSVLDVFERLIINNPGDYINCSTGGAHIAGTRYMDLEEAVGRYYNDSIAVSGVIKGVCDRENRIDARLIQKKIYLDQKFVETILSLVGKVHKLLIKGQDQLPGIQKKWKTGSSLPRKMQKLLGDIDQVNNKLDGYERIWGILEDVTSKGLKKNEQLAFEINDIQGSQDKYPIWLEKTFERLIYVNKVRKEVLELFIKGVKDVHQHISSEQDLLEQDSKEDIETTIALAELYINSRDYVLARPYVEEYIKHKPDSAQANFFKGCLKAQEEAFKEMNFFFGKAGLLDKGFDQQVKEFRSELGTSHIQSATHFRAFDLRVTRQFLLKAWQFCPFHGDAQAMLLELVAHDVKMFQEADDKECLNDQKKIIQDWIRILEEMPGISAAMDDKALGLIFYFMGKLNFNSGQKEKAKGLFIKSVAHSPKDPDLLIKIADLFLHASDYDQGLVYLNRALEMDSQYAWYWERFGDHLFRTRKFDEGKTAYEQASYYFPEKIDLIEKMAQCMLQKGNLLHHEGSFEQAGSVYEEGIGLCTDTTPCLIHLHSNNGSALRNLGKLKAAMACYEKAIEIDPGYAEALYNKGELLQTQDELEAALEYYEKAIKSRPDFVEAYQKMENLLLSMGQSEKAKQIIQKKKELLSRFSD